MILDGRMRSFKIVSVDIVLDSLTCLFDISILGQIRFFILEAAEPAFYHDIIVNFSSN